jgi:hypothetical protein
MAPTCRSGAEAAALLVLLLTTMSSIAQAVTPSAPAVVVFGDWMVDTGNNNQIPTTPPSRLPFLRS